jgi:hypothetical protein
MITAQSRTYYLKPQTSSWPAGDEEHALIALQYMTRGFGDRSEYPQLLARLFARWPLDRNPKIAERYARLRPKIEAMMMTRKQSARFNPVDEPPGIYVLFDLGTVFEGQEPVASDSFPVYRPHSPDSWAKAARQARAELGPFLRQRNVVIFAKMADGRLVEITKRDLYALEDKESTLRFNPAPVQRPGVYVIADEGRADVHEDVRKAQPFLVPHHPVLNDWQRAANEAEGWLRSKDQRRLMAEMYVITSSGKKMPLSRGDLRQLTRLDEVSTEALREIPRRDKYKPMLTNPKARGLHATIVTTGPKSGARGRTMSFVMTNGSPYPDWSRLADEAWAYAKQHRNETLVFTAVMDEGREVELTRDDIKALALAHKPSTKYSDVEAARAKLWPARKVQSNPSHDHELHNREEVERLLATAPSDWRAQYASGASQLQQMGHGGGRTLTLDGALQILSLTAGGNLSSDAARGGHPVPEEVRAAALKGLRLSHANNYGAWNFIGIARAIQLATQPGVPTSTVSRMHNYFTRHVKDQAGRNFGNDAKPSRGYMAWLNWGGDPGYEWAAHTLKKGR